MRQEAGDNCLLLRKRITENLRLCDRRIPFLNRHWLAEMDGCSMGVIYRAKARMTPQ